MNLLGQVAPVVFRQREFLEFGRVELKEVFKWSRTLASSFLVHGTTFVLAYLFEPEEGG